MNRIYEYQLYPRKREVVSLEAMLEQSREAYKAALAEGKAVYEATGEHQGRLDQWDYFRGWRKQPGILLNASSLQQVLRRLDKAYSAFFRRLKAGETPGYPRFKGPGRFDSLEYTYGDGCKLDFVEYGVGGSALASLEDHPALLFAAGSQRHSVDSVAFRCPHTEQ